MRSDIQKWVKKRYHGDMEVSAVEKYLMHFSRCGYPFCWIKISIESFDKALDYYENNVNGSINILKGMEKFSYDKIVFSSATVYGN